jgi:transposase-like protein
MAGKPKYTNESIVAALAQTNGTVYLAAEALGCDPDTIFRRVHKSAAVAAAVRHHKGRRVDNAERKLDAAVERGEPWAVALVLKTLGKGRGYVERQEMTGKDGGPLDVVEVVVRDRKEAVALLEYIRHDGGGEKAEAAGGEAPGAGAGDAGAG